MWVINSQGQVEQIAPSAHLGKYISKDPTEVYHQSRADYTFSSRRIVSETLSTEVGKLDLTKSSPLLYNVDLQWFPKTMMRLDLWGIEEDMEDVFDTEQEAINTRLEKRKRGLRSPSPVNAHGDRWLPKLIPIVNGEFT